MLRLFLFTLLLSGLALALALEFSALTVSPTGRQSYDITTGITTLRDGGSLQDREGELSVSGSFIRYRHDDFIEVEGAELSGSFGRLEAATLQIDLEAGVMQARGELTLEGQPVTLHAHRLTVYMRQGIAVASGGVRARVPDFDAQTLIIDLRSGEALLLGPYHYRGGEDNLRGHERADRLFLEIAIGNEPAVKASREVPPDVLERFGPYLNALPTAEARP